MLSVSGQLDLTMGGAATDLDSDNHTRRTLYGIVHRRDMSTTLQIHDFPDPTQHSPQRLSTTTPLQGLYALNSPLLSAQSKHLADRLKQQFPDDSLAMINYAYWLLFSRSPSEREIEVGQDFLAAAPDTAKNASTLQQYTHALLASNEFLFVD